MVVHMHTCVLCHNNIGTIIGQIYGVAKKATAIAVRVFDATGEGSLAYVYSLMYFIPQLHNCMHDTLHS